MSELTVTENQTQLSGNKSQLSEVFNNTIRAFGVIPGVKLTQVQKANALASAKSLAKVRDMGDKNELVIDVVGLAVGDAEVKTADGEIVKGLSGILIDKEGKGYYTQSGPLMRALGKIHAVFGPPQVWEKPLKLRFFLVKSGDYLVSQVEVLG